MTRITNSEQVLLLLRSHLQRTQQAGKKGRSQDLKRTSVRAGPLARAQQVANTENLSEADVARALISGLLEEEFGGTIANDPKFQQTIDDVMSMIRRDERSERLLKKAIEQLVGDTKGA